MSALYTSVCDWTPDATDGTHMASKCSYYK
jgi:hypothetical protein